LQLVYWQLLPPRRLQDASHTLRLLALVQQCSDCSCAKHISMGTKPGCRSETATVYLTPLRLAPRGVCTQ
jgi:hypothetical protein